MFPHHLRIERLAPGVTPGGTDEETGTWDPGPVPRVRVYDDACDVQDAGELMVRGQTGEPTVQSDATVFLADPRRVSEIRAGDVGLVTWEDGTTSDCEVTKRRRVDATIMVRFL